MGMGWGVWDVLWNHTTAWFTRPPTALRHVLAHWIPFAGLAFFIALAHGGVGAHYGIPSLFREDPSLANFGAAAHANSPVVWTLFGGTVLVANLVTIALLRDFVSGVPLPSSTRDHMFALYREGSWWLAPLAAVVVFPADAVHTGMSRIHVALEAAAGLLLGVLATFVVVGLVHRIVKALPTERRSHPSRRWHPRHHLDAAADDPQGFGAIIAYVVVAVAANVAWSRAPVLVPAASIALLLNWTLLVYFAIVVLGPRTRVVMLAALAAWIVACNRVPYRARFPGIAYPDAPAARASRPMPPRVDAADALQAWFDRSARGRARLPLVVVAASGGAYRSAFYVAGVLDRLGKYGCGEHVRLLTGASGGMVAAAYYSTLGPNERRAGVWSAMLDDIQHARETGPFPTRYPIRGDSLTPVAQQMVRDVLALLVPGRTPLDRGAVLDRQWPTLDARTFADLAPGEADGSRPMLLLSPMVVETGQPLFVSNIDLGRAGADRGQVRELFAMDPPARATLSLATAVRMNASFPYVSPAIELPGERGPLRVVDAGYFDNYGVSAAAALLSSARVRDWLQAHVSRVVLIQVRASPPEAPSSGTGLSRVPHFVTSPIEAAGSARDGSMLLRNDLEVDLLREALRPAGSEAIEVRAIPPFLLANAAAMSWYLTPNDRRKILAAAEEAVDARRDALLEACTSE